MSSIEEKILLEGKGLPLLENDIDTDRIIPARFMKCVTFEGLGAYAFYDVKYDEKGKPKDHILNKALYSKASILITGKNFGCGSSREHAPQALLKYGLKAIIGQSFAEIFAGNCTVLGIPCLTLTSQDLISLANLIETAPDTQITINLEEKRVSAGTLSFPLEMKETYRKALVSGLWDSTSLLLKNEGSIHSKFKELPYINGY